MTTPKTPDPLTSFISSLFKNGGKSIEKFGLYVIGTLVSTNVIDPGNLKPWLLSSVAAILVGLHISTPTPKSGPGQL